MVKFLISTTAQAAPLPTLPNPSSWADTEETAEVGFASFNGRQSEFKITLALDATPSNNLEIAVWENVFGVIDEPELVIGWRGEKIFFDFGGVRAYSDYVPESDRLVLTLVVRLSGQGSPLETNVKANGAPIGFYDLENNQMIFGFNPAWDTARLVSRGVGDFNGRASLGFASDPGIIVVR